ncbi:MAG: hypothetical protein IIA11_05300 [Proteobacteria bacterium]|nr:hypothetical protein [Pseudomonadota bacterium]
MHQNASISGAEALHNVFIQTHYHGATDDQNPCFDTWSAAEVVLVNYMIVIEIADADDRPHWQQDDIFGNLYGSDLTRAQ